MGNDNDWEKWRDMSLADLAHECAAMASQLRCDARQSPGVMKLIALLSEVHGRLGDSTFTTPPGSQYRGTFLVQRGMEKHAIDSRNIRLQILTKAVEHIFGPGAPSRNWINRRPASRAASYCDLAMLDEEGLRYALTDLAAEKIEIEGGDAPLAFGPGSRWARSGQ